VTEEACITLSERELFVLSMSVEGARISLEKKRYRSQKRRRMCPPQWENVAKPIGGRESANRKNLGFGRAKPVAEKLARERKNRGPALSLHGIQDRPRKGKDPTFA